MGLTYENIISYILSISAVVYAYFTKKSDKLESRIDKVEDHLQKQEVDNKGVSTKLDNLIDLVKEMRKDL